jgi:hypothetical protein
MMAKYQINMIKIERRFLKEGGERVDYLRFLKYYL